MDLSGDWNFSLDPENIGEQKQWFSDTLPLTIKLPGSTTENGFGDDITVDTKWTGDIVDRSWFTEKRYEKYRQPGNIKVPFWLTSTKHYVGPAWYQKDVVIPENWKNKEITLLLERNHWETTLWLDGKQIGTRNSLSTQHEYDLGTLSPGKHRLTIRVDNTVKVEVGPNSHSVSDHTQTNWNGIVGKIQLYATDPVFIDDIQIYPDVTAGTAKVSVTIRNKTKQKINGTLTLQAKSTDKTKSIPTQNIKFEASLPYNTVEANYDMSDNVLLWDEFAPNLYSMTAEIKTPRFSDTKSVTFGMRQIAVDGTQFTINGQKIFIRGTLECSIFPLTGYPHMNVEGWTKMIKAAKAHGLNHFRFHSWCPPEAAFVAADRLGFFFQVECGSWANQGSNLGSGKNIDGFIYSESERILKAYGNHPSFTMLTYGNEPAGEKLNEYLGKLLDYWKQKDNRRLYAGGAGWPAIPQNQYHNIPEPRGHYWGAGLTSRMNAKPPQTDFDYGHIISKYDVPVISHEIGQWCVYPDFDEIKKYTGVTRAYNFEIFRDFLEQNHMLDQARDFLIASGKIQTLCYKEEIESALRTPGFAGFHLLDLHDFPGQGTALIGVLDPFWDSKPYVTPAQYHRFACETVPLARMKKLTWTSDETFNANIQIANFGPAPIQNAAVNWTITDKSSRALASGELPNKTIEIGNENYPGSVTLPLNKFKKAQKLTLTVAIDKAPFSNDWDFWVYPQKLDTKTPQNVTIADSLNQNALRKLNAGGKVLLIPAPDSVKGDRYGKVPPALTPIFWNTAWTNRQAPHTLGILCDPQKPALADFPTDFHANWQWWDLVTKSQIMIINDFPPPFRPIVQVIDDWSTNRRLALILEANVNGGKLLLCGIDLRSDLDNRPVARQMLYSLLNYMKSDSFKPDYDLTPDQIKDLMN